MPSESASRAAVRNRRLFGAIAFPTTIAQPLIPDPTTRTVVLLIGVLGCLLVVRSAWRNQWSARLPWVWIASGMGVWVLGMLVSYVEKELLGWTDYPGWADAVWLSAYPLVFIGVAKMVTARGSRLDRIGAFDWIMVMAAGVAFPFVPMVSHVVGSHAPRLSAVGIVAVLAYPLLDLGLLALLAWILTSRGADNPVLRWMGAALALEIVADATWVWNGPGSPQPVWQPAAYMGAVVLMTMGALYLTPELRELRHVRSHRPIDRRWGLTALASVVLPIGGLVAGLVVDEPISIVVSALGLVVVGGLIVLRLLNVVTRSERRVSALNSLAFTDELTKIANRRSVLDRLEGIIATADRPVSVAIIDLDHLKRSTTPTDITAVTTCCRRRRQPGAGCSVRTTSSDGWVARSSW